MLGKIEGRRRRGRQRMRWLWHHRLDGPEFEQAPGDAQTSGVLQSMGSQGVGHNWVAERQKFLGKHLNVQNSYL